jgi:hypothetical protein
VFELLVGEIALLERYCHLVGKRKIEGSSIRTCTTSRRR